MLAVCAGANAVAMADVIAATLAIPLLGADLTHGQPPSAVQWVSTAYLLVFSAMLTVAGRLADLLGHRALMALGAAVFCLAACAAVVTPSWEILLGARAAQGLGAAAMVPASLGLLLTVLPGARRGTAIATWSAAAGLGGVVMHAGGGWLAQAAGWRALFAPSMVVGLALLLTAALALPATRRHRGPRPDLLGALLLAGAIACLVLAISKGHSWGWSSPLTIACALGGVMVLVVVVIRSRSHPVPAVDVVLWQRPAFAWGWTVSLLYGLMTLPLLAWAPLALQEWGYDGLQIGLLLAPLSVAVMVAGRLAGPLGQRFGFNVILYLGAMFTIGGGVLLLADGQRFSSWPTLAVLFGDASPSWPSMVGLVICGIGWGQLSTAASTVATLASDQASYASAVGTSLTARQAGGALGVAGAAVMVNRPFLPGPMAGYASVLTAVVALAVLVAAIALLRIWLSREGTMRATRPASGDPTEMVMIPREQLLALRAALVEVAAAAQAQLHQISGMRAQPVCRCHPHLDPVAAAEAHALPEVRLGRRR
ncbi:MFS transporter [Streptosporangium canum]|uniref:MFS transporter n=1 Tax=Streptosporangium canum TaxID=324952 RepID=UPI0036C6365C